MIIKQKWKYGLKILGHNGIQNPGLCNASVVFWQLSYLGQLGASQYVGLC